jgi:hypothetical protein
MASCRSIGLLIPACDGATRLFSEVGDGAINFDPAGHVFAFYSLKIFFCEANTVSNIAKSLEYRCLFAMGCGVKTLDHVCQVPLWLTGLRWESLFVSY